MPKYITSFKCAFYIDEQEYFITASIGVACFPEHGRQIDHLNNHAEQALSEAKRLGGNTISYYCNKTTNPYKTADLEQELRKKPFKMMNLWCITNQKLI